MIHQLNHQRGPLSFRKQRQMRFKVPHILRKSRFFLFSDVRKIGHDQVPSFGRQALKEIGLLKADIQALLRSIRCGQGQGVLRKIHGSQLPIRAFLFQRQGNTATARTHIQHPRLGGQGQLQRNLDQLLGLRSGNKHPLIDPQLQIPKRSATGHILHGFSGTKAW